MPATTTAVSESCWVSLTDAVATLAGIVRTRSGRSAHPATEARLDLVYESATECLDRLRARQRVEEAHGDGLH